MRPTPHSAPANDASVRQIAPAQPRARGDDAGAAPGPAIITTWKMIRFSAIAAANCAFGTSRGMNACPAGAPTALSADPAAASAYSAHKEASPRAASVNSATDTDAWPAVTASTSRRRSTRSARVPPGRVITSSGMNVARPIPPTAAGDRVRSYTWSVIANVVIADPVRDSMVPSQSRRKAGCWRRGVTSVSSLMPDSNSPYISTVIPTYKHCHII